MLSCCPWPLTSVCLSWWPPQAAISKRIPTLPPSPRNTRPIPKCRLLISSQHLLPISMPQASNQGKRPNILRATITACRVSLCNSTGSSSRIVPVKTPPAALDPDPALTNYLPNSPVEGQILELRATINSDCKIIDLPNAFNSLSVVPVPCSLCTKPHPRPLCTGWTKNSPTYESSESDDRDTQFHTADPYSNLVPAVCTSWTSGTSEECFERERDFWSEVKEFEPQAPNRSARPSVSQAETSPKYAETNQPKNKLATTNSV